jgi:crotonobetaine/carnitine-CoA ligase
MNLNVDSQGELNTDSHIRIKGKPARWHDMPALLRDKAIQHKDKIFTIIDGNPVSYRNFDESSDKVAANFHVLGVRKGDYVASLMFNCATQAFGWFGANKLGAVWVPLNASLTGTDLAQTLLDTGAKILVVDDENSEKIALLPAELRASLTIFVDGPSRASSGMRSFEELLKEAPKAPDVHLEPGTPAIVLYSGGTTGLPKGIVLPHFAFICAGYRYGEVLQATAEDCHYTTLPMFHGSGTQLGIIGPLLNDMRSVIDRRFSVSDYWDRVRTAGATIIDPIGTMMTVLTQAPETSDDRRHNVRLSTGVNGQVPEWMPRKFSDRFGIAIVDIYGSTESGGAALVSNQLGAQVEGAVGRAHGWSEIAILDMNDCPVAPGVVGEIGMRPTIPFSFMLGYHRNPEKTVSVWRNMWLHTGDLGWLDESGNLFFAGRQAHWLRRRGENISAYELEGIISQHDSVTECVVVGVPAELGDEDVKLFVIRDDPALDERSLIEWCIERMAAFKVPRFVEFVDEFPRSVTKREVERAKLKSRSNLGVWDRDLEVGRLSTQTKRSVGKNVGPQN